MRKPLTLAALAVAALTLAAPVAADDETTFYPPGFIDEDGDGVPDDTTATTRDPESHDHEDPPPLCDRADPECGQQEWTDSEGNTCWAQGPDPVCGPEPEWALGEPPVMIERDEWDRRPAAIEPVITQPHYTG